MPAIRTPLRALVTSTLTAACVVALLGTPPVQAASAQPVVTPATAKALVAAYMVTNSQANAHFDTALQDKHERDSAAAIDDANYRLSKLVGYRPGDTFSATGVQVFMPRQTRYPALFVAYFHAKAPGKAANKDTGILLFQRSSAKDSWRVSSEPNVPAKDPLPKFAVNKDGYIPTLVTSKLSLSPAKVAASWRIAQAALSLGHGPAKVWTRTPLLKAGFVDPASHGDLTENDVFTATRWAPVCLASVRGALCFVSTSWVAKLSFTLDQLVAGDNLPIRTADDRYSVGGLPAGNYLDINVLSQRQDAIDIPRKGTTGGLNLLAESYGRISGTGHRA